MNNFGSWYRKLKCDRVVWVERAMPYWGQDSERGLLEGYCNDENDKPHEEHSRAERAPHANVVRWQLLGMLRIRRWNEQGGDDTDEV